VTFPSGGELCAAWYLNGRGDAFSGENGRPCVVMAHGVGGTRDSGLLPFAEAFAEVGLDVVLFDYRSFGGSSGEPRQFGWPPRHRYDYRAAVEFARGLDGVDPERIVLWGTSWSGGHVIYVAADDPRIAAVISQTPDVDGFRVLREIARQAGIRQMLATMAHGIRDAVAALRGREPHLIPIVAPPGEVAALVSDDALRGYEAIAGPSWRNEVTARAVLYEGSNRAVTKIGELACPILIQVAERDRIVPPAGAYAAAWRAKGRSELHEYPCEHFDIYQGEWFERSIADQIRFLRRHLVPDEVAAATGVAAGPAR
jgi:hypothetical protein